MSYGLPGDDPYYLSPEEEAKLEDELMDERLRSLTDRLDALQERCDKFAVTQDDLIIRTDRAIAKAEAGQVPREPTDEMIAAAIGTHGLGRAPSAAFVILWRAMWDAAHKEKGAAAAAPKSHDRG